MTAAAYLTIAETADLLAVSVSTVRRMLTDRATKPGELTRVRVRRAVRIPRVEVEAIASPKRRR